MWDRLEEIERRYHELEAEMARPEVAADYDRLQTLAREYASMQEVVGILGEYRQLRESLDQARAILDDGSDPVLVPLARDELERDEVRLDLLADRLQRALVPRNPFDEKDVIVEIRAAAGGDEATLFAGDLFRMYSR
jgi:peptide chain release factor 1